MMANEAVAICSIAPVKRRKEEGSCEVERAKTTGRSGGWQLVGSWGTDDVALTRDEKRAAAFVVFSLLWEGGGTFFFFAVPANSVAWCVVRAETGKRTRFAAAPRKSGRAGKDESGGWH